MAADDVAVVLYRIVCCECDNQSLLLLMMSTLLLLLLLLAVSVTVCLASDPCITVAVFARFQIKYCGRCSLSIIYFVFVLYVTINFFHISQDRQEAERRAEQIMRRAVSR